MDKRSDEMKEYIVRDASPGYSTEIEAASTEDVPPGYKRTEVGIIPEDWSTETLFDIANRSKSQFDDGDWIEAKFLTTSGIRLLQTGNIGIGVFIEKERKKYISSQSFETLNCKDVFPDDLLICRLADPAGRACVAPYLDHERMITSVDVTIFRPIPEIADPNFLLNIFCTPNWFSEVADRCGGSTRTRISRSQLAQIPVPLPPIQEQHAIATALSDADALIESLNRLITKKRAIKQAAMQQLLTGQTRLPGFTGEWQTTQLGEIGTFYKGRGIRRDDINDEGVPCIRYGELYTQYNNYVFKPVSYIPIAVADTAFPLKQGDLLFAGSGETSEEIGMCVAYLGDQDAFAGGDIVILRPMKGNSAYLGHLLNHPIIANQKARLGQGDAVVHISSRNLAQIEMKLPPEDEQTAIATVLSDMDTEIEALEQRRDKARQIKQGMMQQLLTGRVRLVQPRGKTNA